MILVVQISVYRFRWDSGLVYLGGRGVVMPRFFFAMPPAVVVIHRVMPPAVVVIHHSSYATNRSASNSEPRIEFFADG